MNINDLSSLTDDALIESINAQEKMLETARTTESVNDIEAITLSLFLLKAEWVQRREAIWKKGVR